MGRSWRRLGSLWGRWIAGWDIIVILLWGRRWGWRGVSRGRRNKVKGTKLLSWMKLMELRKSIIGIRIICFRILISKNGKQNLMLDWINMGNH